MSREKLAKNIYYTCLILCAVVLILGTIIFSGASEDDIEALTQQYLAKRMVAFYAFTAILASGVVAREWLLGIFDRKKLIIKIAVLVAANIVGTALFLLVKNTYVYNGALLLGMVCFGYSLIPTVKPETK